MRGTLYVGKQSCNYPVVAGDLGAQLDYFWLHSAYTDYC